MEVLRQALLDGCFEKGSALSYGGSAVLGSEIFVGSLSAEFGGVTILQWRRLTVIERCFSQAHTCHRSADLGLKSRGAGERGIGVATRAAFKGSSRREWLKA